jgi:hypothetical protein
LTRENHQDYIYMTMITAGAAVFFIFNLGHPDNSTGSAWIRLMASGMAMGAMLSYGALVLYASNSLVYERPLRGIPELHWKREKTRKVITAFWIMIVVTGFLAIFKMMEPLYLEMVEPNEGTETRPERQMPRNQTPGTERALPEDEPSGQTTHPSELKQRLPQLGEGRQGFAPPF